MKRRWIGLSSVASLLILLSSCLSSAEIAENTHNESNNIQNDSVNTKEVTNKDLEKLKSIDLSQFGVTKLEDASIYFVQENGCNQMYYLINKSREETITSTVVTKTIESSSEKEYTLTPRQNVKLGCGKDSSGNTVQFNIKQ